MTNKNGEQPTSHDLVIRMHPVQLDEQTKTTWRSINDAQRKARAEMDEAAMAVLAAGWRTEQCCVRHHITDDGDKVETLMVGVDASSGFVTGQEVYVLTTRLAWEGERLMFSCTGRFVGLPHPT
jgi:hypothetical protein